MMGEKDAGALSALCYVCKKFVTGLACSRLHRHLLFLRQRPDVRGAEFEIDIRNACCRAIALLARLRTRRAERLSCNSTIVLCDQFLDKMRVGVARSAAQSMIQVADGQVFVTKIDKLMEQGDGIAAAGDADEVAFVRPKVAQEA